MQIQDHTELLDLMLADTSQAPDLYRPTHYWSNHERKSLPELKKYGLKDFRRRKKSILASFSARDELADFGIELANNKLLNNRLTRKIPLWKKTLGVLSRGLSRTLPVTLPYGLDQSGLEELAYQFACVQGKLYQAKSLRDFSASLIGNPQDVIRVKENVYTMTMLNYYLRYVYCSRFVGFEKIKLIAELGCGAGKQTEVLKKLYPRMTHLLFDIPPQLYVCEQYLKAVFPDDVISYEETRGIEKLDDLREGKIYIFGNWKFPVLRNVRVDLFWNASSFQEMEPDVVENYLKFVNTSSENVYLQEMMQGKEVARKNGRHGVLVSTTMKHYRKGLSRFDLVDQSPSQLALGIMPGYSDSFWRLKSD